MVRPLSKLNGGEEEAVEIEGELHFTCSTEVLIIGVVTLYHKCERVQYFSMFLLVAFVTYTRTQPSYNLWCVS